jgi:hypothetical protein
MRLDWDSLGSRGPRMPVLICKDLAKGFVRDNLMIICYEASQRLQWLSSEVSTRTISFLRRYRTTPGWDQERHRADRLAAELLQLKEEYPNQLLRAKVLVQKYAHLSDSQLALVSGLSEANVGRVRKAVQKHEQNRSPVVDEILSIQGAQ